MVSDLASFHDVLFPLGVSFGATGGPERRNEIISLTSGREKRNSRFAKSRRHYDAGTGLRSLDDLQEVIAFFEARRGSLHAFRFRDPFEMKSCAPALAPSATDQSLGRKRVEKSCCFSEQGVISNPSRWVRLLRAMS
jgi:uncharacterized protein (TIGR02217 family)